MYKPTNPMDATRDLRLKTGFPEDATRWMRFIHFLALPAQLMTRRYLGLRVVGIGRLFLMLAFLFLISNSGAGIEFDDRREQWIAFAGNMGAWLVLFGIGLFYRFRRAAMRRRGEKVNSLSMGVSRFGRLRRADTTERYVDGLYCMALGSMLDIFTVFPGSDIFGDWLFLSGLCLMWAEKYVNNIRVKQYDGLLNAEGHEAAAAAVMQPQTGGPAPEPSAPLSTGLDPDLAKRIRARESTGTMQAVRHADPTPRGVHKARVAKAAAEACTGRLSASEIALVASIAAALALAVASPHAKATAQPVVAATAPANAPDESAAATRRQADDYYFGHNGKAQNHAEAARLYSAAAGGGDVQAITRFAYMILTGQGGFVPDPVHAFPLFVLAAGQGDLTATTYYADLLASGKGGYKNEVLAVQNYRIAARSNARAMFGLALMYRDGRGALKPSDAEYIRLSRQSAEAGYGLAQLMLGAHYVYGNRGLRRDARTGVHWLQKAVDQDITEAKVVLGRMYAGGDGVAKDDAKAVKLLIAAVEDGDANAKFYLARLVLEGRGGLTQDLALYVSLIVQAAAAGVEDAVKSLEVLKSVAEGGNTEIADQLAPNGALRVLDR